MDNTTKAIFIGAAGGVCAGLIGLGGGIIMIPGMVFFMGVSQHAAHATSLAAIAPLAVISTGVYHSYGNLDIILALLFAVGGMFGAYIGSSMMPYVNPYVLKRIMAVLCIIAAVKMGV